MSVLEEKCPGMLLSACDCTYVRKKKVWPYHNWRYNAIYLVLLFDNRLSIYLFKQEYLSYFTALRIYICIYVYVENSGYYMKVLI